MNEDLDLPLTWLPSRQVQWAWLLEALSYEGTVREVGPGRIEVDLDDDDKRSVVFTVVITPDEWESVLRREGAEDIGLLIGETMGPRDGDELFLVVHENRLARSTREELPPVRGTAMQRLFARHRSEDPGGDFGWFANPPARE